MKLIIPHMFVHIANLIGGFLVKKKKQNLMGYMISFLAAATNMII